MLFGSGKEISAFTDEQLMKQMSRGNQLAFECIYDRYFQKLVRFALGYVKQQEQARDIAQDIFLKLIERPEMFDPKQKFSTWIYAVTANRCKQHLRDSNNRLRILRETGNDQTNQEFSDDINADKAAVSQKIEEIYSSLSTKEKSIYTLRFKEEKSIKEISQIIGIPEGSVKSGIYYLLKKFNYHLKEY